MDGNKRRSSTTEYSLLNNIYDECLTYLGKLKANIKSIHGTNEEEHIEFIEEAAVVEMMNVMTDQEVIDDDDSDDSNDDIDVSHDNIDVNDDLSLHDEGFHINGNHEDDIEELIKDVEQENQHDNDVAIETEFLITNEQNINKDYDKRRTSLNQDKSTTKIDDNNLNTETKSKSFSNEEITTFKNKDHKPLGGSLLSMQPKSERLRKFSRQLPKIIITQSNASLQNGKIIEYDDDIESGRDKLKLASNRQRRGMKKIPQDAEFKPAKNVYNRGSSQKAKGYGNQPERLVFKSGVENVALISNVPFEKIRLLNDTFHTLINLRWRWIVSGTIVVHFAIWLIFAIFLYITALAHYDFEPNPPNKTCITGGIDFTTIFLASVEAQTTIGFGDRTIDEECPESIFLFVMQLILGTGCSGVLTCVVYAKLTRPEKLSRDGVGFSKNAVICLRDGVLCLMIRAWDLNYDHIIGSQFTAHFVHTHRTKEGEMIRYYSRILKLESRQFLLWPVTLIHVIDKDSALYNMSPETFANNSYEIVISLKGASASMGTFTQSQTSYLPKEILWGYKFPSVVRYDHIKQKYVIEKKKLDCVIPAEVPDCSARDYDRSQSEHTEVSSLRGSLCGTPSPCSFSETIGTFHLERTSSFRKIKK